MELQPYEKLKKLREQSNFTQDYVAKELGISRQTISKWETGKSSPDIGITLRLCDLYGISIDELLNTSSKNESSKDTFQPKKDTVPANNSIFNSFTLSSGQIVIFENITLAIVLLLVSQYAFIGVLVSIIVAFWMKRTGRNYKIIYLLCIICFIASSYSSYVLIDFFFFNNYTTYIEKVAHIP